jgi:hypothetical protein
MKRDVPRRRQRRPRRALLTEAPSAGVPTRDQATPLASSQVMRPRTTELPAQAQRVVNRS